MPSDFTLTLLRWFRDNGRELPWRGTHDPYAVWLSEVILQQTQVKQGWEYWERFMRRWPTVADLAAATEDEVLREWQGLGYYSRARNLHAAARQIVAAGGFPTTIEGLRALKGVGDYTAAAIGSIAFGLPAAVVDGNVYRVLSRYYGIATPINTTEGKKEFAALAQSLLSTLSSSDAGKSLSSLLSPLSPSDAGKSLSSLLSPLYSDYNQAIMDFGAIQCTPQSPRCERCPLMESCVAFREGRVAELPVKLRKLQVRERRLTYIYVRCQGMTAIHRRGGGDIWQGLYEPVVLEVKGKGQEVRGKGQEVRGKGQEVRGKGQEVKGKGQEVRGKGQEPVRGAVLLRRNVRHVLTHRVLYADFYLLECAERPELPADYIWVREEDLSDYGVPRLIEKMFNEINSKR